MAPFVSPPNGVYTPSRQSLSETRDVSNRSPTPPPGEHTGERRSPPRRSSRLRSPTPPALLGAAVLVALCLGHFLVFNFGAHNSMPRGIYLLRPPGQPPAHLALFCLPPALARQGRARGYLGPGNCPGGAAALLKPIVAYAGDRVVVSAAGVRVNGLLLPDSAPQPQDRHGRRLALPTPASFVVPTGHFFPLSTFSPNSWDGRYWGSLPMTALRASATPLLLDDPLPQLLPSDPPSS
jgi:conjugative transfer signal peptidase TraF